MNDVSCDTSVPVLAFGALMGFFDVCNRFAAGDDCAGVVDRGQLLSEFVRWSASSGQSVVGSKFRDGGQGDSCNGFPVGVSGCRGDDSASSSLVDEAGSGGAQFRSGEDMALSSGDGVGAGSSVETSGGAGGDSVQQGELRGVKKNTLRNRQWRKKRNERKKEKKAGVASSVVETVVTTAAEAEELAARKKELQASFDLRRKAENEVATLKAQRLAASLRDEDKCKAYDDMKVLRLAQWSNQARSLSQKSWKECAESRGKVSSAGSAGEYMAKKQLKEAETEVKVHKSRSEAFVTVAAMLHKSLMDQDGAERPKLRAEFASLLRSMDSRVDDVRGDESDSDSEFGAEDERYRLEMECFGFLS